MTEPVDLSDLPTHGFGSRSPTWWGTFGFIALEGTGFALAGGATLFLASQSPDWPMGAPPPGLLWGSLVTLALLLSAIPNLFVKRWARQERLWAVRLGLLVMCVAALTPLCLRILEFGSLNVWWDSNAYGSAIWFLLGLHTVHLLTDAGDTLVLTALMFTRYGKAGRRFSDTEDNAVYWDFVVLSWLPIYALIYWLPRW
jgi:cytochrome c oxidase subunit 3